MTLREVAILVAVAIPFLGRLLEIIGSRVRLRGFSNISAEINQLARELNGEVDRDGGDVLIHGSYKKWPVLVRFSHAEHEPGIRIHIPVPTNLSLFCFPNSHAGEEGETLLRTSDDRFMSRFRLSTNNSPLEVSMVLSNPEVTAELGRVCDSQTSLVLAERVLDLSSKQIIPGGLASRLKSSINGMVRIATEAVEAVGAADVHLDDLPKRATNWFRIAYILAPALILGGLVVEVVQNRPATAPTFQVSPASKSTNSPIPDPEATQIPGLADWHIAEPAEFNPDAAAWLQQQGQRPKGHISVSLNNDQQADDVWILKRAAPAGRSASRMVLFVDQQSRYDAEFPQIDIVAPITKDRIGTVEWRGRAPVSSPDADGIILIQRYDDPASARIFFMSGPKLLTGVPKDFRTVSLE